jgi:hypothetical protein
MKDVFWYVTGWLPRGWGLLCWLALFWCAVTTGCGGGHASTRVAVHGRITVAGKPIEEGSITFFPIDGNHGPTAGGVIKNGEYSIPARSGPVPGMNRVKIDGLHMTGRKVPAEGRPEVLVDEAVHVVPVRYQTGILRRDVKPGELNFELEAK